MERKAAARDAERSRGFSLIDALTGMGVLLITILALIGSVPAAFGFTAHDSMHVQAVAAGQTYLDVIRQYIKSTGVDTNLPQAPTVYIDPGYSFVSGQPLPQTEQFSLLPSCTARSLFSFDCTVTVSWYEGGATRTIQVESYIASQAGF
jgi:Tfp pilus assembly protein PilV